MLTLILLALCIRKKVDWVEDNIDIYEKINQTIAGLKVTPHDLKKISEYSKFFAAKRYPRISRSPGLFKH